MTFKTSFYGIPADVRANAVIPLLVGPPGADATVADGSITNAKLANVATATFKGRTTAGTGVPQDLTATQATALLNLADGSLKGLMSAADFTKLAGVASGATANTGTVTTVSVVTANGVSGSVANAGTTPAITLTLGAITPTSIAVGGDAILVRDAANTLAQRNGTNAQTFVLYQTYTDPSNYRGLEFGNNGTSIHRIRTVAAGTGAPTSDLQIGVATQFFFDCPTINFRASGSGGATHWTKTSTGQWLPGTSNTYDIGGASNTVRNIYMGSWLRMATTTVASLPAAATAGAGARMFVTDALTPVFGSAVTGGGAVTVPVYSTGSAWNVG